MEKVGSRPYVVVYFNADAELAMIPEPSFFLDAHSALAPSHRRQLKVPCWVIDVLFKHACKYV